MSAVVSMTGVGSASGDTELGRTLVELRAVNGRGISFKHRLAPAAAGYEAVLEKAVASKLRRGTVTCIVDVTPSETSRRLGIDPAVLRAAADELRAAAAQAGLAADFTLSDLLALPGVVALPNDAGRARREASAEFTALVERAVAALCAERGREGAEMAATIARLLDSLTAARAVAVSRAPAVLTEYRARLLARINEFLASQAKPLQAADVLREVALFAERVDAAEELGRLDAHLARARALLAQGGEVGRSLEFLLQEMLREINTLGSKSQDVEIAHAVVGMKADVDKLRELVANLE